MLLSVLAYFYSMLARFVGFNKEQTFVFGILLFVLLVATGFYFLPSASR
jgi:hypothetical protein